MDDAGGRAVWPRGWDYTDQDVGAGGAVLPTGTKVVLAPARTGCSMCSTGMVNPSATLPPSWRAAGVPDLRRQRSAL